MEPWSLCSIFYWILVQDAKLIMHCPFAAISCSSYQWLRFEIHNSIVLLSPTSKVLCQLFFKINHMQMCSTTLLCASFIGSSLPNLMQDMNVKTGFSKRSSTQIGTKIKTRKTGQLRESEETIKMSLIKSDMRQWEKPNHYFISVSMWNLQSWKMWTHLNRALRPCRMDWEL